MTLIQLMQEAWDVARETATTDADRLWSKAEMTRYINRTYRHIARETRCIKDAVTPAVCRITVAPPADIGILTTLAVTDASAAQDLLWYAQESSWLYQKLVTPYNITLHASILDIHEVKWSAVNWRLQKVSSAKWQINPWWEQTLSILPTEYATDYSSNKITLNNRSTATDTLRLIVSRMPLVDLAADGDTPEIRQQYHDFMINGILQQMYSKQDANVLDIKKAAAYAADFALDIDDIKQQERILDQYARTNSPMRAFL